ncbi:hypothetical protein [Streptomyces tendae]|uniref:hypothetical protein n=1 Tax=Streptomyces tendae TaxID=1932 RepID=UPI0036BF74B7
MAWLEPSLGRSLAHAAAHTRRSADTPSRAPGPGVRARRGHTGGSWQIEIRCVLTAGPHALATVRAVRTRARNAVQALVLPRDDGTGPGVWNAPQDVLVTVTVTITITITRIIEETPPLARRGGHAPR